VSKSLYKPQIADVGFLIHKKNKLSKLIAWFMKSEWSHSFLVCDVGHSTYVCETSDYQVCINTLDRYLSDENVKMKIYRRKKMDGLENTRIKNTYCLLGSLYGYFQLISLGIRRLLMRVGVKIPNFIFQGVVCCHVVMHYLSQISNSFFYGVPYEALDTEEVYQMVLKSNEFELVYEGG
jgi:hypothetical protein